jgi:hypothetical protein
VAPWFVIIHSQSSGKLDRANLEIGFFAAFAAGWRR